MISFTIAYFLIGTPTSLFLGFYMEMGAEGFWYGFDVAIYCVCLFLSYILIKTNFEEQINQM